MIMYEDMSMCDVVDAMEALAYQVLHYQHPTWHSIPEEEVVQLLREEGIVAYIKEDF